MDDRWFKSQQKKVGVTADEIAAVLNRDRSVVSKILSGKQKMTLEWANAFAEVLQVPLAQVLEHAGLATAPIAQKISPGFADSDAAVWTPGPSLSEGPWMGAISAAFGGGPGIDVWRVKSRAMALAGYLQGDFMLVDTHQSERVKPGDIVIAQVYNRTGATTVLRRFEPPVLVAASVDPADGRVFIVDSVNVAVMGKVIASWRV